MNQERLLQVLLAPQVSEKATSVADKNNQVIFKVAADATKPEIKAAVELLFKVEVDAVQVLNVKGKGKRRGGGQVPSPLLAVGHPLVWVHRRPGGAARAARH